MMTTVIPLRAETLTPFYYHGLYAMDGSATDPSVLTDTTLLFALQTIFFPASPLLRSTPSYAEDLSAMPWRASLLMGIGNELSGPLRRTVDMEKEGGRSAKMQKTMSSGFYKNQFFTHSVQAGAQYDGLLVGPDPFTLADSEELVIRVGVGRGGMVRLRRSNDGDAAAPTVRLNAATACLFGRGEQVVAEYRILDTIRPSRPYALDAAAQELQEWNLRP